MRRQKGNVEQQWVRVERSAWGCVGDRPETDTERKKREIERERERERWGGEKHPAKEREKNDSENMAMENTYNRQCCNAML